MGLAGTKNKKKWAKDPNNTAWSRNTDTFGQKIMRSQGWQPGEYLGAKDAAHSEYFTAANASHIRAVLKDDNMGLGAKRNQGDECTGLDALQELLGRLNGKSEDALDEERKKREDTRINKYLHRKLGTVRFVYGGLLVGDKVQELADALNKKKADAKTLESADSTEASEGKKDKKSKKRKAEEEDGAISERKEKKSKKRKADEADDDATAKRKEKKDKKKKKESSKEESIFESKAEPEPVDQDADEEASSRKKSKKDKKEKRKKSKDEDEVNSADTSDSQSKKKKRRKAEKEEASESAPTSSALPTESSTPSASGMSTPVVPHRHLARKRFIAQKRAAVMDQAALNQIFMIKA